MTTLRLLLFLGFLWAEIHVISSYTDSQDVVALRSLKDVWQNTPPSWDKSDDPCGAPWEGVTCNKSRVTSLGLSTMGLKGKLSGDIGQLKELRSLDLSFNRDLTGPLSPELGELSKLNILILAGCSFSGNIPDELGNLSELSFLALNSNNFTGKIPPSLGKLSKIYWLDLADNQLTGPIPVSTSTSPGLDLLLKAKHFHFNKNQLSGSIPPKLFSSEMILIHILFDGNNLSGTIPSTLVQVKTVEVLNLAHNNFTGPLPDLAGMDTLNYVDLSNNSFDASDAPTWFITLPSLTTLVMEFGSLQGPLPSKLFDIPQIQQVKLRNNQLNDTLNMGENICPQLQLVDLQQNEISIVTLSSQYKNTLILIGNPVCSSALSNTNYCQLQQQAKQPYFTSLANCGGKSCPPDQKLSPQSCECAYPYEGMLYFRAPTFRELSNVNTFHSLEMSLWVKLGLTPGSVSLQNPFFDSNDYLQVQLALFPPTGQYFNRSEVQRIGFELSNQTYKPPKEFGPYYFLAFSYPFSGSHKGASLSKGVIIGIAVGSTFLVLSLIGLAIYAILQKKRAERAIGLSRPFASWAPTGKDSGGAPQLKGARWFSYDDLKKCTSNFSENNEIGSGGYGKVYKGVLPDGKIVAIKRAQQGSMQGGLEFKTEIELLSRVHHKNLVGLVGFCFEQGEQMLVYEFIPNGTLRESLSGNSHDSNIQGYLDPEYYMTQQLTEKSDVYSFGVVMLELITSRQPIEKGKYIVREVRTLMNKKDEEHYGLREVMDPVVRNTPNLIGFGRFLELAMQCVEESAADRPTMSEVVKALETILQNDGMNTNSTSASSSATDFGVSKGGMRHPYIDASFTKKDNGNDSSNSAFDYSGGYTLSTKVEPK
ncbi:hypothetical protein V8G54_000842 [Vigna mungo]|uniref:non-specific serine/threonine protein kinase n=1 Tax=Vigna mungo TaxID=3915 RepID=A0AAQ3P9G1_VIGMU